MSIQVYLTTSTTSLYEYLFGVGKLLTTTHPLLFGRTKDVAKPESIGFTLATVMHGRKLSEMKKLPSFFQRSDGVIDPSFFEQAVETSAKELEKILRPFIGIRLNKRAGNGKTRTHRISNCINGCSAGS